MISGRTVVILGLAAGGFWLWKSGEWRTVAARVATHVPALADAGGTRAPTAVDGPVTAQPPVAAPLRIRTWTDETGVTHFEQAGAAPLGARDHAVGTGGTMADYEKALQEKEGITVEDIARAKAAREQAAAKAAEDAKASPALADDGAAPDASKQAYELMKQYQDGLGKIRKENNH